MQTVNDQALVTQLIYVPENNYSPRIYKFSFTFRNVYPEKEPNGLLDLENSKLENSALKAPIYLRDTFITYPDKWYSAFKTLFVPQTSKKVL